MAPTDQKKKKLTGKGGDWKKPNNIKKKRKWTPENKVFEGSVKEGQGFAFKRKEKVRHDYNKLLRKERKKQNNETMSLYKEEYPEHLKHLYMAEAAKLKQEAWTNRLNRSKLRMKGQEKREEEIAESDAAAEQTEAADPETEVAGGSELTDSVSGTPESSTTTTTTTTTGAAEKDSLPISNRMRKKMQKKTSYQKTKEEFESVQEKRKNKKKEYLKDKQQREEAIEKYQQKKMETFQMLSKKTRKGQPNLNLQMEYLLQKITRIDK